MKRQSIAIRLTSAQLELAHEIIAVHTSMGDCTRRGFTLEFEDYEGAQAFRNKVFGLGSGSTRDCALDQEDGKGRKRMIRNWDEFNKKLKQVALIDVSVAEHTRVRDLALVYAQAEFDRSTKPALAVRATIAKELEQFYRKHRKEVEEAGKKSIDLTFGRAGFRVRAATLRLLKGFKWPDVIAAIKVRLLQEEADRYIRTKETVKKEELKKAGLDAAMLEQLHVTVKGGEEFFFETFPEKAVNEAA